MFKVSIILRNADMEIRSMGLRGGRLMVREFIARHTHGLLDMGYQYIGSNGSCDMYSNGDRRVAVEVSEC